MENAEEKKEQGIFKPALNHSLLIASALIILSLILYLTGNMMNRAAVWVSYVIMIAGIVYALISYRNETLGGYITYGRSVGYSTVVGLLAGVISGIFAVILYHVISPGLAEEALLEIEREMFRRNPDLDYDMAQGILKFQGWGFTPAGLFILSILGSTFQAVIVGLIAGIFVKKKDPDAFDV